MIAPPSRVLDARALLQLVQAGELDAALADGLMDWSAQAQDGLDVDERALLAGTCQRLRTAWAARERYQARNARLQRRERERREHRAALAATPAAGTKTPAPPALPAAAAAILARARARAGIAPQ